MEFVSAPEFARRLVRHDGFWSGKNNLISVTAPIVPDGSTDIWHKEKREPLKDAWKYFTDPHLIFERDMRTFASTYFAGDALPITHFNLGATGHTAFLRGALYELRDSLWIHQSIQELKSFEPQLDEQSPLYTAEMNILRFYEEITTGGAFLVGNPDNAGVMDALSLLRGDELMCDMYDEPDEVLRVLAKIEDIWEVVVDRVLEKLLRINGGRTCVGWLHTTAPGRLAQMQCDVSAMISPSMFERFCMPELARQCEILEHPLYHLDGVEQVRFLDQLLSLERLETIQWTCVAGQPSPLESIDALKRIQRACKRLIIICQKQEAPLLLARLDEGPILLHIEAGSPQEADALVRSLV